MVRLVLVELAGTDPWSVALSRLKVGVRSRVAREITASIVYDGKVGVYFLRHFPPGIGPLPGPLPIPFPPTGGVPGPLFMGPPG